MKNRYQVLTKNNAYLKQRNTHNFNIVSQQLIIMVLEV